MAVKIRLKRLGKIRAPYYRVVVMDSRAKRDGRAIEEIGKYHPTQEPSLIEIDSERAQYWLGVGAQPTEQVAALLKVTGDWQKFKGEPGAEGTLKLAEPKADKKALFDAASKAAADEPKDGATTPRKKKSAKADDSKADDSKADESKADESKAGEAKADDVTFEGKAGSQAESDQAVTAHEGLSEEGAKADVTPATAADDNEKSSGAEVPTAPADADQADAQPALPTDADASEA
ncbi:30S ribosomal protein S16 [Segeticoccus rhizosphaerae]|uniref:30S ribosomal protein S16 n=1 Tax=Segeticoccus rhizosphaerae TaxID=1104777 RepID=UPI00192E3C4B